MWSILVNFLACLLGESNYSSLSNNHAGCNKHAGWKNVLNLGEFKNQKVFELQLRFFFS